MLALSILYLSYLFSEDCVDSSLSLLIVTFDSFFYYDGTHPFIPPDENHLFVKGTRWNVEGRGMSLVYRRMHPLKPSYTVVAYGGGGTWGYHYKSSRGKLTNRERARLQTFPDWFMFKGNTSQVRAQIGEAVPSILGKKIAQAAEIILNRIKS